MKRTQILAYFSLPVLVALVGLSQSLHREPPTAALFLTFISLALLFYAVPHLLWALFCAVVKPSLWVWHSGFVASSCALLFFCALSAWEPRDSSGLPLQWLAYWPLAGVLLAVIIVCWWLAGHPHLQGGAQ